MNKVCPACNQSNPSEAAFCLNCAAPLPPAGQSGQKANQQWNQPNFGGQPAGQNFAPPTSPVAASQRAIIACVLAAVGLFCCGPFASIPAIIVGWMEMSAIKQGQSPQNGMKFALIGIWGGAAGLVLHAIGFILWLIISMSAATSDPYYY